MAKGRKFIAPGGWFSMIYPENWNEFEDMEGTFLFYDPDKWDGNFRISAYKKEPGMPGSMKFAEENIRQELRENPQAEWVRIGTYECAYSKQMFQEQGNWYITHRWITGAGNLVFECSFTVPKGGDTAKAEEVIATLVIRKENEQYPREIIPIRVLEILTVDESYEWAVKTIKTQLKKDFTGSREDIVKTEQVMQSGTIKPNQRSPWQSFGIAFGVILTNEIEGMNWVTVVDGSREVPALQYKESDLILYPVDLVWNYRTKKSDPCDLQKEYSFLLEKIEKLEK
ncbi:MAG: DUF3805 domain-containing protein [Bacteroides sp.]|nr:DUF3805 domain-containing protein [Bacteroides sp.]